MILATFINACVSKQRNVSVSTATISPQTSATTPSSTAKKSITAAWAKTLKKTRTAKPPQTASSSESQTQSSTSTAGTQGTTSSSSSSIATIWGKTIAKKKPKAVTPAQPRTTDSGSGADSLMTSTGTTTIANKPKPKPEAQQPTTDSGARSSMASAWIAAIAKKPKPLQPGSTATTAKTVVPKKKPPVPASLASAWGKALKKPRPPQTQTDSAVPPATATAPVIPEKIVKKKPAKNKLAKKKITILPEFDGIKGYAIVIGNNGYRHLPRLKTAVNDAKAISAVLRRNYGYEVTTVIDGTRVDILTALIKARKTLTEKDNLLIYYAGHGWLDREADQGYWIPVDANMEININWISNSTITENIRAIDSDHIIVISDSCFSGKLTRGLVVSSGMQSASYLRKLLNKKSRTVMTSGGIEPVSDAGTGNNSVFAHSLIKALLANKTVVEAQKLFLTVRRGVMLNADQTPEYSDMRKVGHDGGDFLFIRKK